MRIKKNFHTFEEEKFVLFFFKAKNKKIKSVQCEEKAEAVKGTGIIMC